MTSGVPETITMTAKRAGLTYRVTLPHDIRRINTTSGVRSVRRFSASSRVCALSTRAEIAAGEVALVFVSE
jgi:hypothetical protein